MAEKDPNPMSDEPVNAPDDENIVGAADEDDDFEDADADADDDAEDDEEADKAE